MALQHLTDEQVRTWTREQKDRWWFENVWRGDMPQLTIRSAITGFILGGLLSATNLYVGAKTGWTLGVGLTSVILAFGLYKVLARLGLGDDFTILENNAMQSIATSAGYMTAPFISSLAAYMMITNTVIPWWQMMFWIVVIALMGVLVAFPMKRRFINDEQQPFPEGRACGVVLDALYTSQAAAGMLKVWALLGAAALAGFVQFLMGAAYQTVIQSRLFGIAEDKVWHLHDRLDGWYYALAAKWTMLPTTIAGTRIQELGLSPALDLSMIGAGGLIGPRITNSLMLGCLVNFAVIAPWMIQAGEIRPRALDAEGIALFGRTYLVNNWCLWWGIAMMVAASLTALFAKPQVIIGAFSGILGRRDSARQDILRHIELPLKLSFVGLPILVAITVWMGNAWFGVRWEHGLLAIPLIIVLTLIAANATALTSTTPTGALSKITQFTFGALDRTNPGTNLMTAGMTAEVAGNASNLLMDIKPGYMLGAKPRQQAVGHCIGIVSGAIAATPLFYVLFLRDLDRSEPLADQLISEKFGMPAAVQWKGVAELIRDGFSALPQSAVIAMAVAGGAAIAMEIGRIVSRNRFPLSALAIGLGVVIPPESTFMMWMGSMIFWLLARRYRRPGGVGHSLWVDSQEPICAGLIAGAALTGIGDALINAFVLK